MSAFKNTKTLQNLSLVREFNRVIGAESIKMTLQIIAPKVKDFTADLDDPRKTTSRASARCPKGVTNADPEGASEAGRLARLLGRAGAADFLPTSNSLRFPSKYPALSGGGIRYQGCRRCKATTLITMPPTRRIGHFTLVAGGSKGEADGGGRWRLGGKGAKPPGSGIDLGLVGSLLQKKEVLD